MCRLVRERNAFAFEWTRTLPLFLQPFSCKLYLAILLQINEMTAIPFNFAWHFALGGLPEGCLICVRA